jgi:hypothetical protein
MCPRATAAWWRHTRGRDSEVYPAQAGQIRTTAAPRPFDSARSLTLGFQGSPPRMSTEAANVMVYLLDRELELRGVWVAAR